MHVRERYGTTRYDLAAVRQCDLPLVRSPSWCDARMQGVLVAYWYSHYAAGSRVPESRADPAAVSSILSSEPSCCCVAARRAPADAQQAHKRQVDEDSQQYS